MDNDSRIRIHEYKIGELNVKITSNTPSPEAIKEFNTEINKLYFEKYSYKR
jgi:hypothetical protein